MSFAVAQRLEARARVRRNGDGRGALGTCALLLALLFGPETAFGVNNDALPDFVFANLSDANRVCVQSGLMGLLCTNVSPDPPDAADVDLGDLDENGNIDAVFANTSRRNRVCFGNGLGGLDDCFDVSRDVNESNGTALGDVNNDDHLDVVFANGMANRVCLGDGQGSLDNCSDVSAQVNFSFAVELGDVSNDGNLDALFANEVDAPNRVCLGNGSGGFLCSDVSPDLTLNSADLALGDVNEDGDLDVVFANGGPTFGSAQSNRICFGDGTGGFSCTFVSLDEFESLGVALGDVNEDGHLDAVFANTGVNRLCLGNGTGLLNDCSDVSLDSNPSTDVELDDLNGDGFFDAVFTNSFQPNRACLGNGNGGLDDCSDASPDANDTQGLAASRTGTYCSSGARTLRDLRIETDTLLVSQHTKDQLNHRLDLVEMALEDGEFEKARDRVDGFISEAISSADASKTPDSDEITLREADRLVCGATNLIKGIPEETPGLRRRGRR